MDVPFTDGARGAAAAGAEPRLAALLEPGDGPRLLGPRELIDRVFALRPGRYLRRMPGRETFAWPGARPVLVVKRFTGGEARDWWYERLKSLAAPSSPARREFANLRALAADGFRVPEALYWVEERGAAAFRAAREETPACASPEAAGRRSALVMAFVETRIDLRSALGKVHAEGRVALGERLAALAARLHDAGWYHRDLYLHQLALDEAGELVLFDAGRARRERAPRRRWFEKDLAALLSSAPDSVRDGERARFLRRYLELRGFGRAARGPWARGVRARAARIRAHVPKHVDRESA